MMHKSKSKSKSHRREWSDWAWDDTRGLYYRFRPDAAGKHEFEWLDDAEAVANHAKTPREHGSEDMKTITNQLGSLSTSKPPDGWSEWAPHDSSGLYYRSRLDADGNPEYDWHDPRPVADDAQTPREHEPADINALTNQLGNLSTSPQGEAYAVASGSKGKSRASKSKDKDKHRAHDDQRDAQPAAHADAKGKGKHRARDDQRGAQQTAYDDAQGQGVQAATDQEQYVYDPATRQYYSSQQPTVDAEADRMEFEARQIAMATAASQAYSYGAGASAGEPSAAASGAAGQAYGYSTGVSGGPAASAYGSTYASNYESYNEEEDEEGGGARTPKGQYHIAALNEGMEALDPRYQVETSAAFQPGNIFKVHWSEPQGSNIKSAPSVSGKQETQNRFGTKFFVGFRRFIVVANDLGHCTCVPILTYGGKACKKKGVKPEKHGIIHERSRKPRLLDGEPKLGFAPIKAEMTEDGETLSKESRVNYSKLVTVEHNVSVFFIGCIAHSDCDRLSEAVNYCWSEKSHHKRRHR